MMGWPFALYGLAAGTVQAALLVLPARGRPHLLSLVGRLLLVGVILLLAARAGQLAFCSAGWITGFAVAGVVVYRRIR